MFETYIYITSIIEILVSATGLFYIITYITARKKGKDYGTFYIIFGIIVALIGLLLLGAEIYGMTHPASDAVINLCGSCK